MTKHTTPWNKIKAEYLQGGTPKELAQKYNITAKQVSDKASKEKWVNEKALICENILENTKNKISNLTNLALEALETVINDPYCKNADKVSASKAILDISGLKSSKQEITGANGEPFAIKKIFISPEEKEAVDEHIDELLE